MIESSKKVKNHYYYPHSKEEAKSFKKKWANRQNTLIATRSKKIQSESCFPANLLVILKKNKPTLFRTRIFTYVLIIFIITGEESSTLCELCQKNLTSEKCGLCGSLTCENCIDFRDEDNLDESRNQIYCPQCGKESRKGTEEDRNLSDSK